MTQSLKLGLIGDNIDRSQSPLLHRSCGTLTGIDVSYDRLIPAALGLGFDAVFAMARDSGFRGINVTYPYKERVGASVTVPDPAVRAIGAVNTVLFNGANAEGFNTDYSGFMRAYRTVRASVKPGVVCLIGTGGVGKAVAFALLSLGAAEIICVDIDKPKALALADALVALGTETRVTVTDDAVVAAQRADGIINCTPLGMVGIGGSPLAKQALRGATWAFDAVYTPVDTPFLQDAADAGLEIISGYELFFAQGLDAWVLFSGKPVEPAALRLALEGQSA